MAFTINIDLSGDQLSAGSHKVMVPRSPMSGTSLPGATFKNNTSLSLTLSFTTTPFTASQYSIGASGSVSPTWLGSVAAQSYPFTVAEAEAEAAAAMKDSVRPATGDINIQVQS